MCVFLCVYNSCNGTWLPRCQLRKCFCGIISFGPPSDVSCKKLTVHCAESVVYVELKHWKSASRKMSVLGWSFASIETLVDGSSPPDDPAPRAGQLFLHLWRKPLDLTAHQRRIQLKALHLHEHDLFLSIASA